MPETRVNDPDDLWGEHGRRIRFLRRLSLFESASPSTLTNVSTALRPLTIPAGTVVCRQGEPGHDFFLIETGTLTVSTAVGTNTYDIARLGPGDYFGEIALTRNVARSATVRAQTAASLWSLSADDFRELLARDPSLRIAVEATAEAREAASRMAVFEVEHRNLATLMAGREEIRIGRSSDNDVVLDFRLVSEHHAVLRRVGESYRLSDLDTDGATLVNGNEIKDVELHNGDELWIGDQRILFDASELQRFIEPRGLRIDALNVGQEIDGNVLLHDLSLSVLPGELVAIVGGSGAGKTTLLNALSGVRKASSGSVLYNGYDYYRNLTLYRHALGYVPQDDIIHRALPLRLTLHHAAKLRLPNDTSASAVEAGVSDALEQLQLTNSADVPVGTLSGGQRKRCSIGVELLTRPRVFFLDEPTSGLDPATDAHMMRLLRDLANTGSTVVLTTHATKNVMLCDRVVFLARGGQLAFVGSPRRALQYFDAEAFDQIYDRLAEEATPEDWSKRFRASADYAQLLSDQEAPSEEESAPPQRLFTGPPPSRGLARQARQFRVLSRRNLDIHARDIQSLIPIVAQPLAMGLMLITLFSSRLFREDVSNPNAPMQLLFLLAFFSFIIGLLSGAQEIVNEFPIFHRERMVNLGVVPYVLSKITLLGPILIGCIVVLTMFLKLTARLPGGGLDLYLPLMFTFVMVALGGLTLALMTSAMVRTSQQATDLLSLWITPQVLFAGALFAVPSMNFIGRLISNFSAVRWAFEASGQQTHLRELFAESPSPIGRGLFLQYGTTFAGSYGRNWVLLGLFIVVPFVLACVILRRKTSAR